VWLAEDSTNVCTPV